MKAIFKLVLIILLILLTTALVIKRNDPLSFLVLEFISGLDNLDIQPNYLERLKREPLLSLKHSTARPSSIKQAALKNTINPEVSKQLNHWFERSNTQALLVQYQGEIIFERYSPTADNGRSINGMSMAKTITALLIGIAIDEGLIKSEQDDILEYLPEIKLAEDQKINIRDLLQQQSGMRDGLMDTFSTLTGKSMEASLHEVDFGDDREFAYSNVNYHLLSLILTRIYQQPLSVIITNKIWNPLALAPGNIINDPGYCCIYATARSWLVIAELIRDKGAHQGKVIVSSTWVDKMINDKVEPEFFPVQLSSKGTGNTYGYHIFSGLNQKPHLIWSEGLGLQLMVIDTEEDLIVIRLGDVPSAWKLSNNRWDSYLYEGVINALDLLVKSER